MYVKYGGTMWGLVSKIIDRCFAVGGAVLACQFPLLMLQYTMVLSGHLAESRRNINMMQHAASLTNKTLQEYIQKFLGQADLDFVHQGELMQEMQLRYADLSESYTALQHSTVWSKPFVFLSRLDSAVFWDTLSDFAPGLTLSFESLIYALIGLVLGVIAFRLLAKACRFIIGLFRGRQKAIQVKPEVTSPP